MTRFHAFNDVFLALVLALSGAVLAPTLAQLGGASAGAVIVLQGLLILAGLSLLLRRRNQGWRDLPFPRPSGWDLLRALQAFGLMFALNVVFILLVIQIAPDLVEAHQLKLAEVGMLVGGDSPFVVVVMLMIFVGFYEEVLARGFLLKRCQQLLGTNGGAVLLSSLLFGLGHSYQGVLGVAQTTLLGLVFASLVLRWKSLWPVIFAHGLINSLSLGLIRYLDT